MKGRQGAVGLAWIMLALLVAAMPCGSQASDSYGKRALSVTDSTGKSIKLEKPATRILCFSPGAIETLIKIGEGSRIIARSQSCDFPEAALKVPLFDPAGFPSADLIIIDTVEELPKGAPKNAGAALFVYAPKNFRELADLIMALGILTGADNAGIVAATTITRAVTRVRNIIGRLPSTTYPRVFWQSGIDPLRTCGADSFAQALISEAGGRNVFSDRKEAAFEVMEAEIVRRSPLFIVLGGSRGVRGGGELSPAFLDVPTGAGKVGYRVIRIDDGSGTSYGPRSPTLLLALAKAFHPDVVP